MSLVRYQAACRGNVPRGAGLTLGPWKVGGRTCGAYVLLETAKVRLGLRLMAFIAAGSLVVAVTPVARWL